MKCLLFSDSHGYAEPMRRALFLHPDAEVVFFLGDGVWDFDRVAGDDRTRTYLAVKGNNDVGARFRGEPVEKVAAITLAGRRILLTHGDLYGARYGEEGLCRLAVSHGADIVLFGHTHLPYERYFPAKEAAGRSFYLFNPGAILPDGAYLSHYGILTLDERNILFSHGSLGR